MSTPNPPPRDTAYFLDPESGAEMARLINLDRLTTASMGGLLPELRKDAVARIRRLLDIGCCPGGWVQEIALASPKIEAVGIDISQLMIEYAQAQAQVQHL